jgi:hypothetical protein
MIESIFEKWLINIGQKMSEGHGINIERDKVPFGVETVDDIEREKQLQARQRNKRKQALRSAIKEGRICFLMYGGVTISKDIMDKFVDGRLKIGNEQGQRRMKRIVKSTLSNDPQEGDYAFICIPAYVKLVPPQMADEGSEAYEAALENAEAMENPMVQAIMADAKTSLSDYEVELDTSYLDKLSGDSLNLFIQENKASIKEMDGYLFGGEYALSFVESMLGNQLVVTGDDGRSYQRDCFAHTLRKVAERLRYL